MVKKFLSTSIAMTLTTGLLFGCSSVNDQPVVNVPIQQNVIKRDAGDLDHYVVRNVQDEVFYFVMPDRFYNGDTSNDNGSKTLAISAGGFDKTDKGMFHGGDIKGLEQKLPYLKEMGISAIWLTPILRNQAVQGDSAGYHGYWVLDFTEIDPHLGSNDDLKRLINAAHKENIKIFFDIITNHTADVIKYKECHDQQGNLINECPYKTLEQKQQGDKYTPFVINGQENVKSPGWLNNIEYYNNQGDTTFEGENSLYGDFSGLDDIDTLNPEVTQNMIDTFKDLISEFKPDGFRIDTVKHVNLEFWQQFAPALVSHANKIGLPEFFMFGEVYSFDSDVLAQYTTKGKMQSVLDFAFQGTMYQAIIEQKGTNVIADWLENDKYYKDQDSDANQLLNFTGNHDMGRFAYNLAKEEYGYSEQEQIDRNLLASAMMYFMRGMPIVYYGDEQGFVGDGGDKDSRQDMMPSLVDSYNDDDLLATDATTADDNFDQNHPFYKQLAEFASVYYEFAPLRHGQQTTLYSQRSAGIYAMSRTLGDEEMVVVFNTSNEAETETFEVANGNYKLVYQAINQGVTATQQGNELTVNLPPLSVAIFSK